MDEPVRERGESWNISSGCIHQKSLSQSLFAGMRGLRYVPHTIAPTLEMLNMNMSEIEPR